MASFGHDAAPAVAELTAWRQTIARRQSAVRTPEDIARARATSERQARLQMHAKKSARLEKCSKMSRAAMAGSMMAFGASALPTPAAPMSLFGASATPFQTP